MHGCAFGFWLPTGRNDFFDSLADREHLSALRLYWGGERQADLARPALTTPLQASAFQRSWAVLGGKLGYDPPYPVLYSEHETSDPEALIYVHDGATTVQPHLFVMTAEGFCLFLSTAATDANALLGHVRRVVGGNYFSHFSGDADEERYVSAALRHEQCLRDYRDEGLGILNFTQLNVILEGLFSYNFDPRVCFKTEKDEHEDLLHVKRNKSLGNFIEQIGSSIDVSAEMRRSANDVHANKFGNNPRGLVQRLLTCEIRAQLLEQFLRRTSLVTLDPLKANIERCRRALLTEVLNVVHRRLPLIQAEAPDQTGREFHQVNEAQLRGYVMLVAAKLPLVINTRRYVDNAFEHLRREVDGPPQDPGRKVGLRRPVRLKRHPAPVDPQSWTELELFRDSWTALLRGIQEDIQELEDAVKQSTLDRQLYESERMRAEQETITELERLRGVRGRDAQDGVTGVLEVAFAAIGVAVAMLGDVNSPQFRVGFAASIVLVFVVTPRVLRMRQRRRWERSPLDGRYIYESDTRLDSPITEETIGRILHAIPLGDIDAIRRDAGLVLEPISRTERAENALHRNSYRVERVSSDEAVHKIHFETFVRWPDGHEARASKVLLHVVYEIIFHRPAGYAIREFRIIATHETRLDNAQLEGLQRVVIEFFINRFLDGPHRLETGEIGGDSLVHLMLLNRDKSLGRAAARDRNHFTTPRSTRWPR